VIQQVLPDGRVIDLAYDANGKVISITPPSRAAHSFAYTPLNLLSAYSPPGAAPEDNPTHYEYSAARDLTRITLADGQTVDFAFGDGNCNCGRLSSISTARGRVDYVYHEATGNLTDIVDPCGVALSYRYDGMLVTNAVWSGVVTGRVSYGFDTNLWVTNRSVNGGPTITYEHDNDGLLIRAGDLILGRSPQNGLIVSSSLGPITQTNVHNGYAELVRQRTTYSGADLLDDVYTRDKMGRITRNVETIGGVTSTNIYDYDWSAASQTSF
jgi:YD repeat-containing protein